jgi:hypothetical protein
MRVAARAIFVFMDTVASPILLIFELSCAEGISEAGVLFRLLTMKRMRSLCFAVLHTQIGKGLQGIELYGLRPTVPRCLMRSRPLTSRPAISAARRDTMTAQSCSLVRRSSRAHVFTVSPMAEMICEAGGPIAPTIAQPLDNQHGAIVARYAQQTFGDACAGHVEHQQQRNAETEAELPQFPAR